MALQMLHSEFPYLWGKFYFLFYQCSYTNLLVSDLDCNSMEDLSRKGEERPMPAVNSFMPLYSSDDSQVIVHYVPVTFSPWFFLLYQSGGLGTTFWVKYDGLTSTTCPYCMIFCAMHNMHTGLNILGIFFVRIFFSVSWEILCFLVSQLERQVSTNSFTNYTDCFWQNACVLYVCFKTRTFFMFSPFLSINSHLSSFLSQSRIKENLPARKYCTLAPV